MNQPSPPSDDALVACPLCGGSTGYSIGPGSTSLWWALDCKVCNTQVCECRAGASLWALDRKTPVSDAAWNAAGNYADIMRQDAERLRGAILQTLAGNPHLADGDDCALRYLVRVIGGGT